MSLESLAPLLAGRLPSPARVEAFGTQVEGVNPCFDVVSVVMFDLTAHSYSREGSPVPVRIDEKFGVGDVVSFREFVENGGC